ncbi:MAG TPA: AhpC/TSA family protein, partial [bacterium]|nr:AhpC/TSA family protein [bacterium]
SLDEHDLDYTLLSDSAAVATRAFGLAYRATNSNTGRLEEASGRDHHILPVPAAFIVGTDGMIKFEYINPNYKVRVKSAIILAAARAEVQ